MSSNRTPWIIAGALGCLALCLLAVIALGAFGVLGGMFNVAPTAIVRPVTPVVILPTVPPVIVTQPPSVQTLIPPPASPTTAQVKPTIPVPTVAQLTPLPPVAGGQPTALPPVTAAQLSPVPPTAVATKPATASGRLAFTIRRGDRPEDNYIWTMNADGSGAKKILDRASEPSFSPDGSKIAYFRWTEGIFVANSSDGSDAKKILGESASGYMAWSHDGRSIAFSVRPGFAGNIAMDAIAPDGTGRRPITIGWSPSWSPDDSFVVFQTCRGSGCGIFRAPSAGGDATPIITDDGGLAAISPNGRTIVYQKDVDGVKQLFVISLDGSGKKQLTTGTALHVAANWSPDGNFIFYRSPEGGQWGIWRMNADGSSPVKLANDMPPGDWPYDRIAVSK
jgi:TolB protein